MFEYDKASLEIRVAGKQEKADLIRQLLVFKTASGIKRIGELFKPVGAGSFASILYVHWYEPSKPSSNRSQFVNEATEMAKRGAVSLLVETMWSDPDFFTKRTQAEDIDNSIRQVIELRQAMDILLSQPEVDSQRFAYVGHDFGAMYGVVMGSIDPRPTHYVLMAGTPQFPNWYLYAPKLEGQAREDFIASMEKFDPITHIANLAPHPVLFQFGDNDFHVPVEKAKEFFEAAAEPKEIRWYETEHELNDTATQERIAWLTEKLGLAKS